MLSSLFVRAQEYRTQALTEEIKSIRTVVDGNDLAVPVIELGSDQELEISFDLMTYDNASYNYKIVHCNADWQESGISSMEYIEGFDNGTIDDYEYSKNVTANYLHYSIGFPNENTNFLRSGNYVVIIAEDYDYDDPKAMICFRVSENLVGLEGKVRGNTLYDINGKYQQLDLEVDYSDMKTSNASSEFVVVIEQNGRRDNAKRITQPTYTQVDRLIYRDSKLLVFEGGNAYRSIDFSSEYTYGAGIEKIEATDNVQHVFLEGSIARFDRGADLSFDVDGKYAINKQESEEDDIEADYMWVHFWLPIEAMLNGKVVLLGDLVRNSLGGDVVMDYDFENKGYYADLYLKQGGYNYLYGFEEKSSGEVSLVPIEGSFWQVENEYMVYVYHRGFGDRYDRLVGSFRL